MKWITPLLLAIALGHLLLGLYGLYAPDAVVSALGLEMTTTGARGEMRALFGLIAAMGVAVARGSLGGAVGRAWLFATAVLYVGLAAGRVVSLGMDGVAAHTLLAGLLEITLGAVLFWAGFERGTSGSRGVPDSASSAGGSPTGEGTTGSPAAGSGS